MTQHKVDNVRVKRTTSYVLVDANQGICPACIGQLEARLDVQLRGIQYHFDALPYSHIIVSTRKRLRTHDMNRISDMVNESINNCHRRHPQP